MKQRILIIISLLWLTISSYAATYQLSSSGMSVSWGINNYIGVYANEDLLKYYVSEVSADANYANFYLGFGLADNTTYTAYSPYNADNWDKPTTAIPASYTSQTQAANASTNHLAAYDYQMAKFTTGAGSASVNFSHIGAILHITWTVPTSATLTSLTLSTDAFLFTSEATMNLQTQSVTSVTKSKTTTLTLDNIAVSANGTLDAYLAILPVNLTGKTITATLTADNGKTFTAKINGTTAEAGKLYNIQIGKDATTQSSSSKSSSATASKASAFDLPHTPSTTTLATLTAYSPDFTLDIAHSFNAVYPYQRGDVNKDGTINERDPLLLANAIARNSQGLDAYYCDVNNDGKINIADVAYLLDICIKSGIIKPDTTTDPDDPNNAE